MNKQKQIEEMAKDMLEYGMAKYPTIESIFTETKLRESFYHVFLTYAEHLIRKGYRKIPEGAVVLTREEYSDYLVMKGAHQNVIERCEKLQVDNERLYKNIGKFKDAVRKETAEKFAERLKEKLMEWLEDNEGLDGKIDFGIAMIELIGVKSLDGEVIAESLIDKIAKEITEVSNG